MITNKVFSKLLNRRLKSLNIFVNYISNKNNNDHKDNPDVKKDKKDKEELNKQEEINGPKGKEPTRYGDWERNGRVYDF